MHYNSNIFKFFCNDGVKVIAMLTNIRITLLKACVIDMLDMVITDFKICS